MANDRPARPNRYDHVFWDLDGTLTDPREGIVRSVEYALRRLGRAVDPESLERFIGPPLARSFGRYYGLSGDELMQAVSLYRERYGREGWRENTPVPGIASLLADLRARGVVMAVATLKPKAMAERILEHFGLRPFFAAVGGPDPVVLEADKIGILGEVLHALGADPARAAMVGDHEEDIRAARHWRMDAVAALYGYGDPAAVRAAGPAAMARDTAELGAMLLGADPGAGQEREDAGRNMH